MSSPAAHENPRVFSAITAQREAVREQLSAVWQSQMDRIAEAVRTGWREEVERAIDEQFDGLAAEIERDYTVEVSGRVAEEVEVALPAARERSRREAAEEFNRAARRFSHFETREQWGAVLLDSSEPFCSSALLLGIEGGVLKFLGARGLADSGAGPQPLPTGAAPAIAAAIQSGSTAVTTTSSHELSETVALLFEHAGAANCAIIPVISRGQAAAVLIAAGDAVDVNGLEALMALAGIALERVAASQRRKDEERQPVPGSEHEALHLRAQRFARVRVAEMHLYKPDAVRNGRAGKKLYAELKSEIDAARAVYGREFLRPPRALPDYLHLELVRSLANEDVAALGEAYPGPLA